MIITKRLESLLEKLAYSTGQSASAKHIDTDRVREIIESDQYIIAPQFVGLYTFPRKLVTVSFDGQTHHVQVEATNIHPHVFCLTCGGYCDYAAAALLLVIVDSEGHRDNESCPECGQPIPFNGEPVHAKSIRPEDEYGLETKF